MTARTDEDAKHPNCPNVEKAKDVGHEIRLREQTYE